MLHGEPLAPLGAPSLENLAAPLGRHSLAEPVGLLAPTPVRLVRPLHAILLGGNEQSSPILLAAAESSQGARAPAAGGPGVARVRAACYRAPPGRRHVPLERVAPPGLYWSAGEASARRSSGASARGQRWLRDSGTPPPGYPQLWISVCVTPMGPTPSHRSPGMHDRLWERFLAAL